MAWEKSPPSLVDLFDACLPDRPGVERRKMFGFASGFVNGNMFAGLFEDIAFARMPPAEWAALEAEFGVRCFEPLPGRPMRSYLVFPEEILEDEARFARHLDQACVFASALPPKARRPRAARRNMAKA